MTSDISTWVKLSCGLNEQLHECFELLRHPLYLGSRFEVGVPTDCQPSELNYYQKLETTTIDSYRKIDETIDSAW